MRWSFITGLFNGLCAVAKYTDELGVGKAQKINAKEHFALE